MAVKRGRFSRARNGLHRAFKRAEKRHLREAEKFSETIETLQFLIQSGTGKASQALHDFGRDLTDYDREAAKGYKALKYLTASRAARKRLKRVKAARIRLNEVPGELQERFNEIHEIEDRAFLEIEKLGFSVDKSGSDKSLSFTEPKAVRVHSAQLVEGVGMIKAQDLERKQVVSPKRKVSRKDIERALAVIKKAEKRVGVPNAKMNLLLHWLEREAVREMKLAYNKAIAAGETGIPRRVKEIGGIGEQCTRIVLSNPTLIYNAKRDLENMLKGLN